MVSGMEGQVEQVETDLTGVREDVRKLEGWFQEMRESLAKIEAQGRTVMAEASLSQTRSIGNQKVGSNVNLAREKDGKEISGTTTTSFRRRGSFRMDLQSETVTTVTAFHEEFEKVSASMKEASDGQSGVFLNGLKEEI
ncbi:hypothetical protein H5410_004029 [Solanum commersonii]|uniref:Uncharacterized protein n=1 Tax=Solanum commersonii TaxID=4109 RepID=A0A9J6B6L7_SOLCO|nr:hypothetical protein H5410_004029 [Solanum commersonii]